MTGQIHAPVNVPPDERLPSPQVPTGRILNKTCEYKDRQLPKETARPLEKSTRRPNPEAVTSNQTEQQKIHRTSEKFSV